LLEATRESVPSMSVVVRRLSLEFGRSLNIAEFLLYALVSAAKEKKEWITNKILMDKNRRKGIRQ